MLMLESLFSNVNTKIKDLAHTGTAAEPARDRDILWGTHHSRQVSCVDAPPRRGPGPRPRRPQLELSVSPSLPRPPSRVSGFRGPAAVPGPAAHSHVSVSGTVGGSAGCGSPLCTHLSLVFCVENVCRSHSHAHLTDTGAQTPLQAPHPGLTLAPPRGRWLMRQLHYRSKSLYCILFTT